MATGFANNTPRQRQARMNSALTSNISIKIEDSSETAPCAPDISAMIEELRRHGSSPKWPAGKRIGLHNFFSFPNIFSNNISELTNAPYKTADSRNKIRSVA
jgi:hypothetical protein